MLEQLQALQARIHAWCYQQFPGQSALSILRHLEEEAQELDERHAPEEAADCLILLLAWAAQERRPLIHPATVDDWQGDIRSSASELLRCAEIGQQTIGEARYFLAFLLGWSLLNGVDLLAEAEAKHAVNLTRQWQRDSDGIHRHVTG